MSFFDHMVQDYSWVCILLAFVLGAIVGSFLNVCISRLPLQKSILWPGSRCGACLQEVRWYDNLPLISYLRLGGKCRSCGTKYSSRYFWIELLTAAMFAFMFWLEVDVNFRQLGFLAINRSIQVSAASLILVWLYHVTFFSFLLVATFTDIDYREIPLAVTITGTLVGIAGSTLGPWPWPIDPQVVTQHFPGWHLRTFGSAWGPTEEVFVLPSGMLRWPVWMPTSEYLPVGSWQMGLATSLTGALVGTLSFRLIGFVFGWALGKEALGLGDADLMMMIGAFLGWQSLVFVMLFAVVVGLCYGLIVILVGKGNAIPFGPCLAGGAVLTVLLDWYLGAAYQTLFFDVTLILFCLVSMGILLFIMALTLRMSRLIFQAT